MAHPYQDDEPDDEDNLFDLYHSSGNVRDTPRPSLEEDPPEDPTEGHNSGDSELDELEVNDLLVMGRKMLLKDLLKAIRGGYASPQEKAILAKLLKDNGMVMGDPLGDEGTNGTSRPRKEPLPEYGKPDYDP